MKKSRRSIIIILAAVLIISAGIFASAENFSFGDMGKTIGHQVVNIEKQSEDTKPVATVNGEKISYKQFEVYKTLINQNGKQLSDKDVLNKMIEQALIYSKAVESGISVSDQEAESALNSAVELLKQDKNQYSFMKNYIAELGMTESEYWKSMIQPYKEDLTIGKFKDTLKEDYRQKSGITDANKLDDMFKTYFDAYKKELINGADIQTDIK